MQTAPVSARPVAPRLWRVLRLAIVGGGAALAAGAALLQPFAAGHLLPGRSAPPPRGPMPLQTELISPLAPVEPTDADAASPGRPLPAARTPAGDRHG